MKRILRQTCQSIPAAALVILFIAIYARAFLLTFPLWNSFKPQATFATIAYRDAWTAFGLGTAALVLVLLNILMWRAAVRAPGTRTRNWILVGWAGASLILLFTYPGQSNDWGDYIFHAHMLAHLGKNPLTTAPAAVIPFDAFPYLAWYKETSPYGPLWQILSSAAHSFAGEALTANILALKLTAILATGASGALIYAMLKKDAPQYAGAGLMVWLWNPLVLNEGALNAHNDVVMVAVALLGFWLAQRKHFTMGLLILVCAGLVKFYIWILVPVMALWILRQRGWRQGLRAALPGIFIGAALVWLAYLPFGGVDLLFNVLRERGWWASGTWTAWLFYSLREGRGLPHSLTVQLVFGAAALALGAVFLLMVWRIRELWTGAWAVTLVYLLLGVHWFQPWYGVLLVAFAAPIRTRRVIWYTWLFTLFMLWQPILSQFKISQMKFAPGGYDFYMALTGLLIPQLVALLLVFDAVRHSACRGARQAKNLDARHIFSRASK